MDLDLFGEQTKAADKLLKSWKNGDPISLHQIKSTSTYFHWLTGKCMYTNRTYYTNFLLIPVIPKFYKNLFSEMCNILNSLKKIKAVALVLGLSVFA